MNIGEKVRTQRELRKLSQLELAKLIGSTQANISRLEQGLSDVKLTTLNKIANALECKIVFVVE